MFWTVRAALAADEGGTAPASFVSVGSFSDANSEGQGARFDNDAKFGDNWLRAHRPTTFAPSCSTCIPAGSFAPNIEWVPESYFVDRSTDSVTPVDGDTC
jgi:hypothetical protein